MSVSSISSSSSSCEVEEPLPPLRLRLAAVVVEELREEPGRVALLQPSARAARRAEPLARAASPPRAARARAVGRHGRSGRPPLQQPLVERDRRAAVLLVVGLDVAQERVVAALEPLLEEDGRLVAAHDLGRAHEPVQRLDRLDRVALDRRAERLLDDAVEVDEHVVAQEVVDLLLARRRARP